MTAVCRKCGATLRRHTEADCLQNQLKMAQAQIKMVTALHDAALRDVATLSSAIEAWHEVRRVAKGGASDRALSHLMSDAQMKLDTALQVVRGVEGVTCSG